MRLQTRAKAGPASSFTPMRPLLLHRKCACGNHAGGGECEACSKQKQTLQRATRNPELETRDRDGVPPIVHDVLRSPGQPLDPPTRAFMEPRFGHDFSQVRVHTDARAAESARAVNAQAYTVGQNIVFATVQYTPGESRNKRILAHELAHIIQQSTSMRRLPDKLEVTNPADASEREAEAAAQAIMQERTFDLTSTGPMRIARAPTFKNCKSKEKGKENEREELLSNAIKEAKVLVESADKAFDKPQWRPTRKSNFGDISDEQKETIQKRYNHIKDNLDSKEIECVSQSKCGKDEEGVVPCAKGRINGNIISICPIFWTGRCQSPGPIILHEAAHNAGAEGNIDKGKLYPPKNAENNAYSYQYFAMDLQKPPGPEFGRKRDVESFDIK